MEHTASGQGAAVGSCKHSTECFHSKKHRNIVISQVNGSFSCIVHHRIISVSWSLQHFACNVIYDEWKLNNKGERIHNFSII